MLVIDTAFETCQVALVQDGMIIAEDRVGSGGQHDRVLASMTEKLFATKNMTLADISKIIVTIGPGRFTGLRVGIAFARGLALVHQTPLVGVLTNDAIYWDMNTAYPDRKNKTALVAVKRGESFFECRDQKTGIISVLDSELADRIRQLDDVLVAGVLSPAAVDTLTLLGIVVAPITEPSLAAIAALGLAADPGDVVRPYYAAS